MSQVIEFLNNRHSSGKLSEPGPSQSQLEQLLQIGVRAPDHGGLQPWQFIVMTGAGRAKLGDIFAQAATLNDAEPAQIDKARNMPMRAPTVITVITKYKEHPKVPWVEQIQSAGCALFSMQQAALAMGFGGIWRTGDFARDELVRDKLGLGIEDEIVGFLYLGTDLCDSHAHKTTKLADKVIYWD